MVAYYTAAVEQERLARDAMAKLAEDQEHARRMTGTEGLA
jgi:hypothetical protein